MPFPRIALAVLVICALFTTGLQCTPSGKIAISRPFEGQLIRVTGIFVIGGVVIRFILPSGATGLSVKLNGNDVTAQMTVTDQLVEGLVFAAGVGSQQLVVTANLNGMPLSGTRNFESMLINVPECELLNSAHCLLPYPSNDLTVSDGTTDTGLRIDIPAAA